MMARRLSVSTLILRTPARIPRWISSTGLHALPTQDHVLGNQKPANREILVEFRPVDSYAAAYETRVAELWKPLERHGNRAAVLKMNDKLAFDDLDRGGSGLLRCEIPLVSLGAWTVAEPRYG